MRLFTFFLLFFIAFSSINAQTNVSGTISTNAVWDTAGAPYFVTGNVTVNHGVDLQIDSSVTVYFAGNYGLYIYGDLFADHVTFTSADDTVGGSPSNGDWRFIQVGTSGSNVGYAKLDTCTLKYGGSVSSQGMIYVYQGQLDITGSDISNSTYHGISMRGGTDVNITSTNIFSCNWPLFYNGTSDVDFYGVNNFTGNDHDAVYMNLYTLNTTFLDTINIPYYFRNTTTIATNEVLTIASGNILKFYSARSLVVNGALVAEAATGENIYFTAYTDDNIGGDTNGDGSASSPATNYWRDVRFNNSSIDSMSVMRRCKVSFAGRSNNGGVTTDNASPTIDQCDFANNYYGAKLVGLSDPVFTNNTIGSSQMVPIAMSFDANPVFSNNTLSFSDNQYDAIGLLDGTLQDNTVLPIRSVTGIPNITYLLLGTVVIPDGITLTINKGIVIKSYSSSHRLRVRGKLLADAQSDSIIVFTSVKDDNHGNPNDTNRDGNLSFPVSGDWSGIVFEETSDPASVVDYCLIKYARMTNTYYYGNYINGGAVTVINSSPIISNCDITETRYGIFMYKSSDPDIINNNISNTGRTPFALSVSADPVFSGNTLTNTSWTALGIIGDNVGTNGLIKKRDVAGFSNMTYLLLGDLVINSGTNVDVESGVVLKFLSNTGIYVDGGFKADGADDKIIFTSVRDDNFGNPGDTNGDGSASSPSWNDWETIRYRDTADDSYNLLNNVSVLFGGSNNYGGVSFLNASGTLNNALISDSYYYGLRFDGVSNPVIDSVQINNCRLDPIAMSLLSNPTFTNISFTANGSQGIMVLEGNLASDATIFQRNIAGINNIAYIVNNLDVLSNAVLTIEPGVVIKFTNNYSQIDVAGALVASGTESERIVFTSIRDDSWGGDTNNDGNSSAPSRGNWYSLLFRSSALDSLNKLNHCLLSYGGSAYYNSNYKQYGEIRILDSFVDINRTVVEQSNSSGIGIFGSSNPVIDSCEVLNIRHTPIAMSMFAEPVFSNNTSLNLGLAAIGIVPENYSLSDTVVSRDFGGYSNITYYLYGNSTVNSGTVITISEGIIFKYGSHGQGRITVDGGLKINGTTSNPVVFTDYRDDSYGNPNDTNGDGSATSPSIGTSYNTLTFNDVSEDANSLVENAVLRYRGNAIRLAQASPTINNTLFDTNRWGIRLEGVSEPIVQNNTFHNLTYAPLIISLVSYPAVTSGNVISGTTYKTIGILSETLVQDVTLTKRDFAGTTNIPYFFTGDYTIGTSVTLTIEPGVIMKFGGNVDLTVRKGLIAEGGSSPDSTIVFTDIRDDFYGGDSNSDGDASTPGIYSYPFYPWSGIWFADESLDPLCRLDFCVVKYAGYSSSQGGIVTNSASPSITNSVISENRNGIVANAASNPVINYSDIYNNTNYGVNNVDKSFVINAQYNWWGTNDGPTHSSNPGGTGDAVTDAVDYGNFYASGAQNPLMGDVSLNGIVQAYDASQVLLHVVSPFLIPRQLQVADVSGEMGVTAYDASLVLQYVVGLIDVFPAELGKKGQKPDQSTVNYLALQKAGSANLRMDDIETKSGQKIVIPVSIDNVNGITAMQLSVSFDNTVLEYESVSNGIITSDMNMTSQISEEGNMLHIAYAGSDVLQTSGEIAYLTFNVRKDIKGDKTVNLTVEQFLANETDMTGFAKTGTVTITGLPDKFSLFQNYPNPFNNTTTIQYNVPDDNVNVRIEIYNINGQLIKTLINKQHTTGEYKTVWNGTNENGAVVASGTYIYRMQAGKFEAIKKFQLLK